MVNPTHGRGIATTQLSQPVVIHPASDTGGDERLCVGLGHGQTLARLLAHPVLEGLDPLHG
jgi:hypothetical protein